ncbi:hypothetical protein CVT25_004864 [Psilocybe cyanescens]|uniref:Uncharacterized protein n=1 Tax=Psilocybe cyanescens TaxID=93625 RepID=A0A409XGM6_PSICY|nr:hypothetical protein CVT25_004864 [Psilocybe cyanescens]
MTCDLTSECLNFKLIDFECRLKSHRKLIIKLHQPSSTYQHDTRPHARCRVLSSHHIQIAAYLQLFGLHKQTTGQPEMTHGHMNDAAKELAGGIGSRNSGVNFDNILVEHNIRSLSSLRSSSSTAHQPRCR